MSNQLTDRQIELLAEGIEQGLSRADLATFAGVAEQTAVRWRNCGAAGGLVGPENCGCGRFIKHTGQCNYRRQQKRPQTKGETYEND
jgi:hypothetical protein